MYQRHDHTKNSTHEQLWELLMKGEREGLKMLYDQYANLLYSYGRHISSDKDLIRDCIQDLFVELWKYHKTLGKTTSVKFYLYKSLRRKIIYEEKKISRQRCSSHSNEEMIELQLPYELPGISEQIDKEKKVKLLEAVQSLPKRQREVVKLIFFENLSREDIAEIMEIDTNTVYALTWKALSTLRKTLLPVYPLISISFYFLFL